MKNNYIPGVCNIGPKEIAFRKMAGYVGLIFTVLFLIIIIVFKLSFGFKLLIFIPVFLTAISFLQVKMHFCAEFGILGKYNFGDKVGNTLSVDQIAYLQKDRVKALKIIAYSFIVSIFITLVAVILL